MMIVRYPPPHYQRMTKPLYGDSKSGEIWQGICPHPAYTSFADDKGDRKSG